MNTNVNRNINLYSKYISVNKTIIRYFSGSWCKCKLRIR